MSKIRSMFAMLLLAAAAVSGSAAEPNYKNDLEKAEAGSLPEEFLVIDGDFQVKEENGNKFLELPGSPLDTYGLLFGPSVKENTAASARVFGTARGRRFPTFDVGLNGVGGYRLRVSPAKKQVELVRNDVVIAAASHNWAAGKWTHLKLAVKKDGPEQWTIQGKVWAEGAREPAEPIISHTANESLPAGRASIFASPYSGTPIRFDDLTVSAAH